MVTRQTFRKTSYTKDPEVIESFNPGPRSDKYTNHSTQNALIEIMAELVLDEIKEEIGEVD